MSEFMERLRNGQAIPYAVAALLGMAGLLKAAHAVLTAAPAATLTGSRWELIVLVEAEFVFAAWLWTGVLPWLARQLALLGFCGFAWVNLFAGLSGESSCGCFGMVPVHPWFTFALDVTVLAVLLAWQPRVTAATWSRVGVARTTAFALFLALVGGGGAVAMAVSGPALYDPSRTPLPSERRLLIAAEGWVGQRFPLADVLAGGADLLRGHWVIVLHDPGCPACRDVLEEASNYCRVTQERHGIVWQVACIEMSGPRFGRQARVEYTVPCRHFQFKPGREWVAHTPAAVRVRHGQTEAYAREREAVRRWLSP